MTTINNSVKRVSFGINAEFVLLATVVVSVLAHYVNVFLPFMVILSSLSAFLAICGIVCYAIFLNKAFSVPRTFSFSTSEILTGMLKLPLLLLIQGVISKYWFNMPVCAAILWIYALMMMAYKIRFWKL
jgi:hypothetical protein